MSHLGASLFHLDATADDALTNLDDGESLLVLEKLKLFEMLLHLIFWIWTNCKTGWEIFRLFNPQFVIHIGFDQILLKTLHIFFILNLK
jgi:hypothetical protein